ncbi:MAG: hypothetical protein ACR2LM_02985 [Pyrinomonadaceae bacterium]
MRRLLLHLGTALFAFGVGAVAATVWKSHSLRSQTAPVIVQAPEEQEWPLTKQIVSRSLQSHSFRSDKLRRNSNDEIVWRWLKESISSYRQNWVMLTISENESYGVVLYPPRVLELTELSQYNKELKEKGSPSLEKDKRYLPITVYQGNIACPSWSGFIDVEEAKLVYFAGTSA